MKTLCVTIGLFRKDFQYVEKWAKSTVYFGNDALLFHNEMTNIPTLGGKLRHIKVEIDTAVHPFHVRWILYNNLVSGVYDSIVPTSDYTHFFFTDGNDVIFLSNVDKIFSSIFTDAEDVLVPQREPLAMADNLYMHHHSADLEKFCGQPVKKTLIQDFGHEAPLCAGGLWGRRSVLQMFCQAMCGYVTKYPEFTRRTRDTTDMCNFGYELYTTFKEYVKAVYINCNATQNTPTSYRLVIRPEHGTSFPVIGADDQPARVLMHERNYLPFVYQKLTEQPDWTEKTENTGPKSWKSAMGLLGWVVAFHNKYDVATTTMQLLGSAGFSNLSLVGIGDLSDEVRQNICIANNWKVKNYNPEMLTSLIIWKKMIEDQIPRLFVFQDNAIPHPQIITSGADFWTADTQDDIILLGSDTLPHSTNKLVSRPSNSCVAYYVTLEGAKRLLTLASEEELESTASIVKKWMDSNKIKYHCWNATSIPKPYPITREEGIPSICGSFSGLVYERIV